MKQFLQFKKQRDLGDILTDTFKFIRLEGKSLFILILKICGPALLVILLSFIYYAQSTMSSFGTVFSNNTNFNIFSTDVILSIILMLISMMIYYALLQSTVLSYIKIYIENKGIVSEQQVRDGVKNSFWNVLGLSFLVGLLLVVGFAFCGFPGIYLGVVLAITYSIAIFEKKDVTDTIGYSFKLIKGEWWNTFATFFVVIILFYIILVIFQIPQYIYFFSKSFTSGEDFSADPAQVFDWVYIALNSIAMIAQYLLYTILVIASSLVYFNLNEKKNFSGTIETIDAIGNRE
ncbi:MAG: hypothetical protein CVU03_03725 [Bacteroidetes bacterium HGW-Bacteroidetes-2]|jgi:hypothetical protein|nr:MAG: hypothetical protein CVU03_03725 [Bacteroidetes bacterium HGW-Bacteroidetes-2]